MRLRLLRPLSCFCCLWFISFHSRCSPFANAEFYSSVDSLKKLGNMEAELIDAYRNNFNLQRKNIETVQRFIEDVKFQHELAKEDVTDYIGNPIKAFALIKRMAADWKDLFQFLQFPKMDMEESLSQLETELNLVDDNELKGAIRGLMRLQNIYKLSAHDLSNGENNDDPLDWNDCYELGATLIDDQSYHLAIDWLKLSLLMLRQSEEPNYIKSIYTTHLREYLAIGYNGIGEYETAIEHLDELTNTDPDSNAQLTRNLLLNYKNFVNNVDDAMINNDEHYARLCRGEKLKELNQLSCKLDSKIHPFFILSPLQVEPVILNPPITLYHNLINDEQISELLRLTHNNMHRSTVVDHNQPIESEIRVSQQTWINPMDSNISDMMYKFVGAITGFDMSNSEILQVANYGIGGQYEPHRDSYTNPDDFPADIGNRISTNMFYLSDVEEGGYTVFPILDTYIKPTKGSMVMWYNLHKSLEEDQRTLHGGCPVLKGSKLIANIWTPSGSQEFRRPCDLVDDSVY